MERTVTFTMEDALISPAGFMILSGAGLIEASNNTPIYVHSTEQIVLRSANEALGVEANFTNEAGTIKIELGAAPAQYSNEEDYIYVMVLDDHGEVSTEPYIGKVAAENNENKHWIELGAVRSGYTAKDTDVFKAGAVVLVDYYVQKVGNAQQIEITADKFGGNYYLEASTLFRTTDGVDMPAEFIIPNCKIQSNFTFTMASSGDPSTFTFTMDAFPDYTRFDKTKKVLAAIQIIEEGGADEAIVRTQTAHDPTHEAGL